MFNNYSGTQPLSYTFAPQTQQEIAKKLDVVDVETTEAQFCGDVVQLVSDLHCSNERSGNFLVFLPSPKVSFPFRHYLVEKVLKVCLYSGTRARSGVGLKSLTFKLRTQKAVSHERDEELL